jgi:peptide/nickel transport system substrate-binding protein
MQKIQLKTFLAEIVLLLVISSCSSTPNPPVFFQETSMASASPTATALPTPSPMPPRVLTICMGSEPASLFLYGDQSIAARNVREAIYDGPFDIQAFKVTPVILEKTPDVANGGAVLESVQVQPGSVVQDASGKLVNLEEGVTYLPGGCRDASCAQTYQGSDPVNMDQLAVRFKLRSGLLWSDGAPLTADDSLYSFEVAQSLFPRARADLLAHTQSYKTLDALTAEWRGVPGYRDPGYQTNFFSPLPRHAWSVLPADQLLTADVSARLPVGWGPYKIDEWKAGDHISLSRNPAYYRLSEGLPYFDNLVFRFVNSRESAISALLSGECDLVDETTHLELSGAQLLQLQDSGRVAVASVAGTSWEHADFGIASLDTSQPALFQLKETRQAIAQCIDRQQMADELFFGKSQVPDTYVPPMHPLYDSKARHYNFDPQAASKLLESVGWLDADKDPTTPRLSRGVPGVPDNTAFQFAYLTADDEEHMRAAQMVQASLAQCGIKVNISAKPSSQAFAPGPEGPVFGRQFAMAQYAWVSSTVPPCFLYTTDEIPGPYPQSPKGWGGANASGYSSPQFDQACPQALTSLPDDPAYKEAHLKAQEIFAEDLPAIPLYLRLKLVATRPDMCEVTLDPSAESDLWNLEVFNYGTGCSKK